MRRAKARTEVPLSTIFSQTAVSEPNPFGGKNTVVRAGSQNSPKRTTTLWCQLARKTRWIIMLCLIWISFFLGFKVWQGTQTLDSQLLTKQNSISSERPIPTMTEKFGWQGTQTLDSRLLTKQNSISSERPITTMTEKIGVSVKIQNKDEIRRLSPPETVVEQGSLQLDEELMIFIGGYTSNYNLASQSIQFFNISSQLWLSERRLELPPGIAHTHQGIAFDSETRMIYIVSGQLGGGCLPAVTSGVRMNVDTGEYELLPSLPKPRYHPGVAIIKDPSHPEVKHLHVFGGAAEIRNQSATDHWRLILNKGRDAKDATWQELEDVPDAGAHGRAFVHNGAIYYTAFCDLDQGVVATENMKHCQRTAFYSGGQILHHTVDAGLMFRYVTDFAPGEGHNDGRNHWERLPDMPFPACHTGSTVGMGRIFLFGGGISTNQNKNGSPPTSLNMIQMFNFVTQSWEMTAFRGAKNMYTYNMGTWMDYERRQLYGLRSQETLVIGHIESTKDSNESAKHLDDFKTHKLKYLETTRHLTANQFVGCLKSKLSKILGNESSGMEMHSVFDSGYESVRTTWNKRLSHLQYPDVVTFPDSPQQVSMIVQCARRTGHHVCGRNGKHSFEADTCTYGIVVDVAKMSSAEVLDLEKGNVRFGSGQHLGRVAVTMEKHGIAVPMGHCASVGLTGLVLVGGQGILSRHLGLTSDYVSGIQLVDHDGQIIDATIANEYSDYVWLARGGGSGVQHFPGIITSIEFSNLPKLDAKESKPKVYTSFRIAYLNATAHKAEKLLLAWQEFYLDKANTDDPIFDRLTVEPWIYYSPMGDPTFRQQLYLECYFYGNDDLHQQLMERFLPKLMNLLPGDGKYTRHKRWEDLAFHRRLAGVGQNNTRLASGKDGWDLQETLPFAMNRWKGYSAVASNRVPGKAFRELAESIYYSQPFARRYVEFKPLGGAIQKLGKKETAFWHRDAIWWCLASHYHRSTDPVDMVDAIHSNGRKGHNKFVKNMGSSFSGSYAGYIDHGNSTGRDLELYYGENAGRIAQIKKHRDPYNIFRLYLPNTVSNAPFNPKAESLLLQGGNLPVANSR